MTDQAAPPTAGRREWIGLAILALPTLLLSVDISVMFLALPHLAADLGADSTQMLWITDMYGFMVAGFLVTMGTIGDRIGRRRLLLVGAGAFGLASVAAAYSATPWMLVAARAALGIAGAALLPSTLALITSMFRDPRQRRIGFAAWVSCFSAGVALGPVVGGVMLEHFWWGAVFLLGVPTMLLLLALGPVLLPEYRQAGAGRPDLASVALSLGAILPVIYGLKELARHGWQPLPVAAIVAGVAAGVVFVRRQRTLADPLIDVRLFGLRSFSAALGVMLLVSVVMGGTSLLVVLYLQMVEGLSPLRAGLWQVPSALALLVTSQVAPHLARRVRPGSIIAVGLVAAAAGFGLLTQVPSAGGLAVLVVGFVIVMAGVGIGLPLGTDFVVGSAPPQKAGSASAISQTSNELGIALGIAVLGSLGTAVYRAQMSGAVPADLPAQAAEAAQESVAAAVSVAGQLQPGPAAQLLDAARDAFTAGLHTVAAFDMAGFVAMAVVAVTALRHVRPSDTGAGEETAASGETAVAEGTVDA